MQDHLRFLPTTITNSRKCKTECIDKGFTFCSSVDHRNGTCYGLGEVPIVRDVCSNSISSDSDLKYWSCNYNLNCTENYKIKPKGFTTTNLVTLQPRNAWVFLENFCTYLLQFPDGSGLNDTLNFRVNIQKQVKVYYMWGTSYSDAGVKQKGWAKTGTRYNIPYPMQGYLILQGT